MGLNGAVRGGSFGILGLMAVLAVATAIMAFSGCSILKGQQTAGFSQGTYPAKSSISDEYRDLFISAPPVPDIPGETLIPQQLEKANGTLAKMSASVEAARKLSPGVGGGGTRVVEKSAGTGSSPPVAPAAAAGAGAGTGSAGSGPNWYNGFWDLNNY